MAILKIDPTLDRTSNIKNIYKENKYKNIKTADNYYDVFKNYWLVEKHIAKYGLIDDEHYANTLPAYEKAISLNYSILIPVQMNADGTIICFGEKCLGKATSESGYVCNLTDEKLKNLNVHGEKIPTLAEALDYIANRTPVIINIINDTFIGKIEDKVFDILNTYSQKYDCANFVAIMSSNPYTLAYAYGAVPQYTRILQEEKYQRDKYTFGIKTKLLRKMKLYKITYADFIATPIDLLPSSRALSKKPVGIIALDVTGQDEYTKKIKHCDNIVFSGFIPTV